MRQPPSSSPSLSDYYDPSPLDIKAVHDRDCIDRAKFRYDLPFPLPDVFLDQFADAKMTIREFSKSVPFGRDLFTVVSPGIFRADGLVRGTKITVSFHGDPNSWPMDVMRNFEGRLQMAGYCEIHYISGEKPKCTDCPSRFEKKCHAFYPGVLENLY